MNPFSIEVRIDRRARADDPHDIAIRSYEHVFTRLLRQGSDHLDDWLQAPPSCLAFWLVDNWWRLRFECVPPAKQTDEWRLAHDLASIGGGYVWPRLSIWGEGERIGLVSHSDPPGVVGPVRYVTDAVLAIPALAFETAVDSFVNLILDERLGVGSDRDALITQWRALCEERDDPEITAWRRLEAELGFDADTAPDALITALAALAERFGERGIEEAVQAAPGLDAATILNRQIAVAENSGWDCDFSRAVEAAGRFSCDLTLPPWRNAREPAQRVREFLGVKSGAVSDKELSALADMPARAIKPDGRTGLVYGLRLRSEKDSRNRLVFRAQNPLGRRFELGRAVGDAIWAGSDALGPVARSKTSRQKFQRAFAQSLLCPFEELMSVLSKSDPTEDDVAAAAFHFNVSEMVIRNTLMNYGVLEREHTDDQVEAA